MRRSTRVSRASTLRAVLRSGCATAALWAIFSAASDPTIQAAPPGYKCIILPGTYEANGVNNHGEVVGRTAWSGESAQAFYYKSGELLAFGSGGYSTVAMAISDSGFIAGIHDVGGIGRAMMADREGNVTNLPDGGAAWSEAYSINNAIQAVGYVDTQDGWNRAAFWDAGSYSDISGGNERNSSANAINNFGGIVGWDDSKAAWFDPTPIEMGAPGTNSFASAMSDSGFVVGTSIESGIWTAWIHDGSGFQSIVSGPVGTVRGLGVNNLGHAVGVAAGDAFLWYDGAFYALSGLIQDGAGTLREARSINDCGVIVGYAEEGAFMLVPIDSTDTADEDGDGLLDRWERCGLDLDMDGVPEYRPPGADPRHADLYLELDHVAGAPIHPEVVDSLVAAFARVPSSALPVPNPDGTDGINLHFIVDDGNVIDVGDILILPPYTIPGIFDQYRGDYFGTNAERQDPESAKILEAKRHVYHYCVVVQGLLLEFPDLSRDYVSGIAECHGNDLMMGVSAFRFPPGTWEEQAGTIMHELGHNLGLSHGGDDQISYKVNYFSVMNYTWQIPQPGFSLDWRLDYSSGGSPTVDESMLNESTGLANVTRNGESVAVYIARDGDPSRVSLVWTNSPNVDFDGDGVIDPAPVNVDINHVDPRDQPTPMELHRDYNDWANILFDFRSSPSFPDGNHEVCPGVGAFELSRSQIERLAAVPPPDAPSSAPQVHAPEAPDLGDLEVGPNPFTEEIRLRFSLPAPAPLSVQIFGVNGRVVTTLFHGTHDAGVVDLVWDGRDVDGNDVASGLYVARVQTGQETRMVRVIRRR